jgi:aspartyl-tRNA(Asn)/glutamyl-tRNA(Gln) amidotransferase subunit C
MSQTQHPDLGNLDQQGHLALDPALVKKVARLARLSPSEQELDSLSHELGKILEHFQNIEALDTDDVEPTYHRRISSTACAPTRSSPPSTRLSSWNSTPKHKDGCLMVPRTVE